MTPIANPWVRMWTVSKTGVKILLVLALISSVSVITGGMVVMLPPLAVFGIIGLATAVLLWVMPDLPLVNERQLKFVFFAAVFTQFSLPVYYAIALPGLPWISIRRVLWFSMIALTALAFASSASDRARARQIIADNALLSFFVFGYLGSIVISILTSAAWPASLQDAVNSLLYWYFALFV